MRMQHFRFIGGLVVGTLLVGGISWAAIPTSTTGVFYGCANKTTGALRVIDYQAGKRCTAAERTITWNQKGATGARGAAGAAGVAGSAGAAGAAGADGATVLSGSGSPTNSVGVDHDFYIDLTTGALYGPKTSGTWGGSFSLLGPQGLPGLSVLSGAGIPSAGLGTNGDFYINTTANTIYGPKAAGAWGTPTSLVGPQGATGATGTNGTNGTNGTAVLNGARTPLGTDGANGDFWLNTATSTLYGPKAAGTWPGTGTSLVGTTGTAGTNGTNGTNGASVLSGARTPVAGDGANGDFWLDTATSTLYGPKAAGAWPGTGTSLVGPTGATGATGSQGAPGVSHFSCVASQRWDMAQCKSTTFNAGLGAHAMTFDGNNLWVLNGTAGTVTKYSVATNSVLGSFPVGTNPNAAAFDGTTVWVLNQGSNNISRINVTTGATTTITAGSLNKPFGIVFDGANMWVTNSGAQTIVEYSIAATPVVIASYPVTATVNMNPYGVTFDGHDLWIAANDSAAIGGVNTSELIKMDPATGTATHNAVTISGQLYQVATDGVYILANEVLSSSVGLYDEATISFQNSYLAATGTTSGMAFDGQDLWVTNPSTDTVTRIDVRHGGARDIPAVATSNPTGVLFDGDSIWVANAGDNTVVRYHP